MGMKNCVNYTKKVGSALIVALLALPTFADETQQRALFTIERSKNANVVQYDVRVDENGKLAKKKPVVAYWIRPGKDERIRKLSWIQRTFAYGFKAKLNKARDSATLDLVADIGRLIHVNLVDGNYLASMRIDGVESYVERLYIKSTGSGASTSVDYIDLQGRGVESGEQHYERFIP